MRVTKESLPFPLSPEFGDDPEIDLQPDGNYQIRPTPGVVPKFLTALEFAKELGVSPADFCTFLDTAEIPQKAMMWFADGRMRFAGFCVARLRDHWRCRQAAERLQQAGGSVRRRPAEKSIPRAEKPLSAG